MISQLAIESIEELEAQGLHPTPADVIRLNAMGLKLEAVKKRTAATSLDYLPRVAALTDKITFRQPSVGHEIWIDQTKQLLMPDDYQSLLAITAFALAHTSAADLPRPDSIDSLRSAIDAWLPSVADLCRDQIYAAVDYCLFGASPLLGEKPSVAHTADDPAPDMAVGEDWGECVAVGVLHEGHVALWGMTRADMEKMTRQQLEDAIRRAYLFHGFRGNDAERNAEGDYYATLAEIRTRLTAAHDSTTQPPNHSTT